jgi:hypothetical protein
MLPCNTPPESSSRERRAVVVEVVSFKLPRELVFQCWMQVILVVVSEPVLEGAHQLKRTGPLLQPEALLFEGAHEAFYVGVALWVIVAGERLMDLQCRTGLHEGLRGRLTPVVPAAAVQLSWTAPTKDANGAPLTDLAGYNVYYGLTSLLYGVSIDVGLTTNAAISGLVDGLT